MFGLGSIYNRTKNNQWGSWAEEFGNGLTDILGSGFFMQNKIGDYRSKADQIYGNSDESSKTNRGWERLGIMSSTATWITLVSKFIQSPSLLYLLS